MKAALLALVAALLLAPAAQSESGLPNDRALVVTTSVSPATHLFAEPVVARVDVVVDAGRFDPDSIDVRMTFAPYQRVGAIRRSRRAVGGLVHLRYAATLRCLHIGCLAPREQTQLGAQESGRAERHSFQFRPVQVRNGDTLLVSKRFPPVEVVSRVNTARLEAAELPVFVPHSEYVASLEPPDPTYRASPTLLAALALVGALLLLLFPATLAGRALYARWQAAHRPRPLSPLERALALVDWTAARENGEEDRRKALELLADVLEQGGVRPLADATRELAWDADSPDRGRSGELAAEAKQALAREGNGRPA